MTVDDEETEVLEARNVAFVYDVHGNQEALQAVLEDLEGREVDLVVFGGDYALNGPRPAETVEAIRQSELPAIRGNTDEYLLADGVEQEGQGNPVVEWTRGELSEEQLEWMRQRPFAVRVAAPGMREEPGSHLLAVHATPTSLEDVLLVEEHPHKEWPVTDEEEAAAMVGDVRADVVVYGHIHSASAGVCGEQRVRSIGSVGFPWDGDRRAAYGLARWNGDGWVLQDIRVDYDWESVADEIETSGAPRAEARAASIRDAAFEPLAPDEEEDGEEEGEEEGENSQDE